MGPESAHREPAGPDHGRHRPFQELQRRIRSSPGRPLPARGRRTLQSEAKRYGDLVFRIGGEERARCAVRALGISHPDPQSPGIITLSLGAAVARPGEPRSASPEAFMQEVDGLLYQAKSRGRDQLIAAGDRP